MAKKVIDANALVIRDEEGKIRAEISVDDRDNVTFFLLDQDGRRSIAIGVTPEGRPMMGLTDSGTKHQLTMSFTPIQTGGFTIYDANYTPRAQLLIKADGTPILELRNGDNESVFVAPADK